MRDAAAEGANAGSARFFDSWVAVADQMVANAEVAGSSTMQTAIAEKYLDLPL